MCVATGQDRVAGRREQRSSLVEGDVRKDPRTGVVQDLAEDLFEEFS